MWDWIQLGLRPLAVGALMLVAATSSGQVHHDRDPWRFTPEEMEQAFRYQQNFGLRPPYPLKASECSAGKKEIVVSYHGKEFPLPCLFIQETTRHLTEILEKGAAKYLFALDAGHAHFVLPTGVWERKYRKLTGAQFLMALVTEPALAALYHTAELLTITDSKTGKIDPKAKAWKEKRNVLGFYDGRSTEVLPPDPTGSGVGPPKGYELLGTFYFLANPRGEILIFLPNETIAFDITFTIDP